MFVSRKLPARNQSNRVIRNDFVVLVAHCRCRRRHRSNATLTHSTLFFPLAGASNARLNSNAAPKNRKPKDIHAHSLCK